MRNQVLEFNSGLIDENGIFGDRFEFFQANYAKSENKIKKARTFKVVVEILMQIQLYKIKSLKLIRDAIRTIAN